MSGWGDEAATTGWGDEPAGKGWSDEPTNTSQSDKPAAAGWCDESASDQKPCIDGENNQEERPAPYKPAELDLTEETKLHNEGAGENFQRYKDQKVTCVPPTAVKPVESFSDVLESKLLLQNLVSLNYTVMTPIQKWAIPAIFHGFDMISCAQTGSGKTAAFLLPALQTILKTKIEPDEDPNCQNPYCLVISPTRELAKQIHTHAELLSKDSIIKARVIYGQIATSHLKAKLASGCQVLVSTPGRLKDFVERGWISFKNIKYIILDEGDRLVDDGFSSQIDEFFNHPTMPPKEERQTLFFSATFKPQVQRTAKQYLKDNFVFLTVGRVGAANEDIKQEFLQVCRQDKKRELKEILKSVPENDKTIVFTQTKQAADILAGFFNSLNLSSTSIHGDRHQSQREEAITAFKRGLKRFLISSPVGNRGLDLPKVALVINYDLPPNIDEYVHRIGRTGRVGHTGRAISFFDRERDAEILPDLLTILKEAKQEIPEWMSEIPAGSSGFGWDGAANSAGPDNSSQNNSSWDSPAEQSDCNKKPADSGWGSTNNDDGWGSSSGGAKDKVNADSGWGSSSNNNNTSKSSNAEWGSSSSGNNTHKTSDSGWGAANNQRNDRTTNSGRADSSGWGTSSSDHRKRPADSSWGGSSTDDNRKRPPNSSWGAGGGNRGDRQPSSNWASGSNSRGRSNRSSGSDWGSSRNSGGPSNSGWGSTDNKTAESTDSGWGAPASARQSEAQTQASNHVDFGDDDWGLQANKKTSVDQTEPQSEQAPGPAETENGW